MKLIILITLLIFTSLSCLDNSTDKNNDCKTNDECKEDYVCVYDRCVEDYCAKYNYDCGTGYCYMRDMFFPECKCEVGHYQSANSGQSVDKCHESYSCETSRDCLYMRQINPEGDYSTDRVKICSFEGECTNYCETSLDCKGKEEVCIFNNKCYQLGRDSDLDMGIPHCGDDYYNDRYNNLRCTHKCGEDYSCDPGFSCVDTYCVPRCLSNENCLKDKFTGDICDETLRICVE